MKAVILAAGKGTRLRPLTYAIPKPLLPVGGKPVIDYVRENILTCKGVTHVFIAVSHMREVIEEYIRHTPHDHVHFETIATLGWETGGDLKAVAIEKDLNETLVVAYGDNVTNIDLEEMHAFHKKHGKLATVSLFKVPWEDVPRFGVAELKGHEIKKFVEKPEKKDAPSNLANAGYFILEPEVLEMIPEKKIKIENTIFPKLAEEGELAGFLYHPKHWLDVGTMEAYRKANRMLEGILPPP